MFGPANLAVQGPQPAPVRIVKRKPGRPRKLAQPEHDSAFQLRLKQRPGPAGLPISRSESLVLVITQLRG